MSWPGAIIGQAGQAAADSCAGLSLPLGRCLDYDGLLGNWASSLIAAAVLAARGLLVKRGRKAPARAPGLTDEVRSQLLAAARSRSWGQLHELIGMPAGFTELRLEPRIGLITGARSTPAADGGPTA